MSKFNTWAVNVVGAVLILLCGVGQGNAVAASFTALGDLDGGTFFSRAEDVSDDGSVIVGFSDSGAGNQAFRWTSGGMVGLGGSMARGVSGAGSVVVGSSGNEAYTWPGGGLGNSPSATRHKF